MSSAIFFLMITVISGAAVGVDVNTSARGQATDTFTEYLSCPVVCDENAVLEGEPPLFDGYQDAWNGGCNSPQFGSPFQTIDWANTEDGEAWLCGASGWYLNPDGIDYRDTDWYIAYFGPTGAIEITLESEYPCYLKEIGPQDCDTGAPIQWHEADCDAPASMTVYGPPATPVWIWVAPTEYPSPVGTLEFPYIMTLAGHEWEPPVSSEEILWGKVKALYR